jgi:ubiquinone/menaquinone biosynthesis C-methylase UbiE
MLRAMTLLDAKLLFSHTRTTTWTVDDPEVLQAIGDAARMHAHALTKAVIPACDGLGERLRAPGGAFLDIGVGVAATAIAFAQMWPGVRVVGIDPWQPSLRLARENVEGANMKDRIELREQGGEQLEDDAAFDLAWMAIPFMPERAIRVATERTLRALRPGGWAVLAPANFAAMPPPVAAVFRLRTSQWGGPEWTPADVEELLREKGYVEVQTAPSPPGSPAAFVVGRRRPV